MQRGPRPTRRRSRSPACLADSARRWACSAHPHVSPVSGSVSFAKFQHWAHCSPSGISERSPAPSGGLGRPQRGDGGSRDQAPDGAAQVVRTCPFLGWGPTPQLSRRAEAPCVAVPTPASLKGRPAGPGSLPGQQARSQQLPLFSFAPVSPAARPRDQQ